MIGLNKPSVIGKIDTQKITTIPKNTVSRNVQRVCNHYILSHRSQRTLDWSYHDLFTKKNDSQSCEHKILLVKILDLKLV